MTEKIVTQCKAEGCGKSSHYTNRGKRGYCDRHYLQIYRNGRLGTVRHSCEGSLAERFWARVNKNGSIQPHMSTKCWEWTAGCIPQGYGTISEAGTKWLTHRLSWFFENGVNSNLLILHECDNKKCVNPSHLREGTHKDNKQDEIDRNKHNWGMNNGKAILSADDVIQIRKDLDAGKSCTEISKFYDVGMSNISAIKTGRSWNLLK